MVTLIWGETSSTTSTFANGLVEQKSYPPRRQRRRLPPHNPGVALFDLREVVSLAVESVRAAPSTGLQCSTAGGSGPVGMDDGRGYAAFVAEHPDSVVRKQREINGCRQR